ncbi:ParB/Srx family N-terminal domain-containing protein [Bradyrhizobium barranii]
MIPHLIFLPLLLFVHAAAAGNALCDKNAEVGVVSPPTTCDATSKNGVPCACDVRTLRPLQGAVGMEEVRDKADKIKAKPGKACQKLVSDPIKVIRGPGGALFITDHHHGADAWRLAERPFALCEIADRAPLSSEAQFWSDLIKDHLVRLADANGKSISPEQLPSGLAQLPDDPYRSLAWRLRKNDGFCRSIMQQKEFAEFTWADWLRMRPELPVDAVRASAKQMLPKALALARSSAAKDVPGYVGDKPSGFRCPDDD